MGFTDAIAESLKTPLEVVKASFSAAVMRITVALLIFFIGFMLGRIAGRITKKILHHMNIDFFLRKTFGLRISFEDIITGMISYFIYIISFVMALNQLGLSTAILNMVIGGVIVILIISIILSIKDFVPNFVAGLVIREKGFISENDVIRVKDIEGKVTELGIIETIIQNSRGDRIFVPNLIFTKNEVINYKPRKPKKKSKK